MSEEQKTKKATKKTTKKATAKKKVAPNPLSSVPALPQVDQEKIQLKRELEFYKNKVVAQNQIIGELYTELKTEKMKFEMLRQQRS